MQSFTEPEVLVIQKQRKVLLKVTEDIRYPLLSKDLREAISRSLAASAEVLI